MLVDPRRCLSQRIVVGRARAPRGEEERRDGKGRSTCESSIIQPRNMALRRSTGIVKWGIPTPASPEQVRSKSWGIHSHEFAAVGTPVGKIPQPTLLQA